MQKTCQQAGYQEWSTSVFPAVSRIIAIGDIHGDLSYLRRCLLLGKVIDKNDNWIGKSTYVVQLGDQLDACRKGDCENPKSQNKLNDMDVLNYMDALDVKARKSKGRVISIMGNHELMNMEGDMSYVNFASLRDFNSSISQRKAAFALKKGPLALRLACTRIPFAIIGKYMFSHAGIDAKNMKQMMPHLKNLEMMNKKDSSSSLDSSVQSKSRNTSTPKKTANNSPSTSRKGTSQVRKSAVLSEKLIQNQKQLQSLNTKIKEWIQGKSKSFGNATQQEQMIDLFWTRRLGMQISSDDPQEKTENTKQREAKLCESLVMPVLNSFDLNGLVVGHSITNTGTISSACNNTLYRIDVGGSSAFELDVRPTVLQITNNKTVTLLRETTNPLARLSSNKIKTTKTLTKTSSSKTIRKKIPTKKHIKTNKKIKTTKKSPTFTRSGQNPTLTKKSQPMKKTLGKSKYSLIPKKAKSLIAINNPTLIPKLHFSKQTR